jgi:putative glutamine amidotransferase
LPTEPLIALTAGHPTDTRPYTHAIEKAGGIPLVLLPGNETFPLLSAVQGLVLAGGASVHPERYGADFDPRIKRSCDEARDRLEWSALDHALEQSLPVLGICRGMQLINVYFGGTLHQSLPHAGFADVHRPDHDRDHHAHHVQAVDGYLRTVLGDAPLPVNSIHRQGVNALGRGLKTTVLSDDGLAEGIETDDAAILAVQWHPEELVDTQQTAHALFADLVSRTHSPQPVTTR